MLIRSLVALSLTSVALLAGCGDDEPQAASTPAPVATQAATTPQTAGPVVEDEPEEKKSKNKASKDKPEWVNAVNERCQEYQQQTTKALNDFQKSGSTSPEAMSKAMNSIIPLGQEMVADLRKVEVPGDVSERWNAFLDTVDGAFELMPQIAKTAASGQPDPELMKKFAAIEKDTRPFSDEFGLNECLAS